MTANILEFLIDNVFGCLLKAVIAAGIGIIATGVGFVKKSVPATIVAAIIICSIISNASTNLKGEANVVVGFAAIVVLISSTAVTGNLLGKVNRMEA